MLMTISLIAAALCHLVCSFVPSARKWTALGLTSVGLGATRAGAGREYLWQML